MAQLNIKPLLKAQAVLEDFRHLKKYPYTFYAFGSRVKGNARKLSDLDLCYKDPIPDGVVVRIEEDFENSDLPFKVDLVSWHRCDDAFQALIDKDAVELSTKE